MNKAIILHGTMGSPEGNWFRWLEAELVERNIQVWLPTLPRAEQPSLEEWSRFVHANRPFELDDQTMIIGHSSGAILALVLAQQSREPIGGVVAVSVFHDNSLGWEPNGRLFDVTLDYDAIRDHAEKLLFIHSDNDPYVPLEQARYVADACGGELVVLPGQGHFNLECGDEYSRFPRLLELLSEKEFLGVWA